MRDIEIDLDGIFICVILPVVLLILIIAVGPQACQDRLERDKIKFNHCLKSKSFEECDHLL